VPEWYPLAVVGAVIVAVVLAIVRLKVNPVIALAVGAAAIGLLSGLGAVKTVDTLTEGFGSAMVDAGLLIAWGVLIGSLLNRMGAVARLVESLLRIFGPKGVPFAIGVSFATYLQTIFLDALIVLAAPLARRIAPRLGRAGVGIMATTFAISGETGIALMVPGIGSVMIAASLDVPIGRMLVFGLIVVVPTVIVAIAIMSLLFRAGFWNPERDEQDFIDDDAEAGAGGGVRVDGSATGRGSATATAQRSAEKVAARTQAVAVDERAASTPLVVLLGPLLVSLVLIAIGGVLDVAGATVPVMQFLGAPVIALLLGVVGTAAVTRAVLGPGEGEKALGQGFRDAGQIFALTGVGGSLAAIVAAGDVGPLLESYFSASTVAPILLVWLMAAVLHIAVGSVTLSAMTAAGILAPVASTIGLDPLLIGLAAGAGALFCIHVTSNTFWLLQTFLDQSVRGALKTVTLGVSVSSICALGMVLVLSAFV